MDGACLSRPVPGDADFDAIFTPGCPVIFAFHAYPALIHRLTYRRSSHADFHVHGYREEGTITTPFDMTVLNRLDRFHLAIAAVDRVADGDPAGERLKRSLEALLIEHRRYINENGEDLPEIRHWRWANQHPT